MSIHDLRGLLDFRAWIPLIEMMGALLITSYVLRALWVIIRRRDDVQARLLVAEGAVAGLSLKLAATLLKTLLLVSWTQIGMFAVILTLRTLLKKLFAWERGRLLAARQSGLLRPGVS